MARHDLQDTAAGWKQPKAAEESFEQLVKDVRAMLRYA